MPEQAFGGDEYPDFVMSATPRLLRTAYLLTGDVDRAWDLTQETLVRVGLRWGRIRKRGSAHSYAERTLVRLHIDIWRRLRQEIVTELLPNRGTADTFVTRTEAIDELTRALKTLGRRQRAIVVLRYFHDKTFQQIAEVTGTSVGNAKSQHSRALRRLREHMTPPDDETEPVLGTLEGRPA